MHESAPLWTPLPGPQTLAANSTADVIGYGGAAGGGKTDLICGLALTKHQRSIVYRKEGTQLLGVTDRIEEIVKTRDGFNSQSKVWRINGRILEFGGLSNPQDHKKYQGRAHDLKTFDECTEIPEYMVRFLMGWTRTSDAKQRTRILMTFNPPTTAEGEWVIDYFGPWLDPAHGNPARHGELRWYTTIDGKDEEVPSGDLVEVDGEMVQPVSRTFIGAKVEDNPYYMDSGYKAMLQSMPEPLRSQMLRGDFTAGKDDNPWQVMPTQWVEDAMARWRRPMALPVMDAMGVDVARGGKDFTIIARRHGMWFDEPLRYPGATTPDGPLTASLVVSARRDKAPVIVDVVGWGASPHDFLVDNGVQSIPYNGANSPKGRSKEGGLGFYNRRSESWWRMREALDPANNTGICLPDDKRLKVDLCTPRWSLRNKFILVEPKEQIIKRIHRSPDDGDAYVMALEKVARAVTVHMPKPIKMMGGGRR